MARCRHTKPATRMFVNGSTGYQDVCEWGNWIRMETTCTSSPEKMCIMSLLQVCCAGYRHHGIWSWR